MSNAVTRSPPTTVPRKVRAPGSARSRWEGHPIASKAAPSEHVGVATRMPFGALRSASNPCGFNIDPKRMASLSRNGVTRSDMWRPPCDDYCKNLTRPITKSPNHQITRSFSGLLSCRLCEEVVMKRFAIALLIAVSAFPVLRAQQAIPEIPFDSVPNAVKLPPDMNFGEDAGVAVNSKGHVFVYTRSNSATGSAYGGAASQLFEFDQNGKFVREIGKGLYAWAFAHVVRIDKDDNIWAVDKGSDMIIRFNPEGHVTMVFGRKKEASDKEAEPWERNR